MSGLASPHHIRPAEHLVSRVGPAHRPGSVRYIDYSATNHMREHGRYPVHYWPSVAEQVAEATLKNAQSMDASTHVDEPLFTMLSDCGHTNPEDDEKFDGVDDLIDDWLLRNCRMDGSWPEWIGTRETAGAEAYDRREAHISLIGKNRERAEHAIPLAAEWRRAQDWFDDNHSGTVCLASPAGSYCVGCADSHDQDPDYGIEPFACRRQADARDRRNEFWDHFTADSLERAARLHADAPFELEDWID